MHAQTAPQRDHVLAAQAHAFFKDGRYFQAAQAYAQCSVTFEEVTLKFLDVNERDALRSYLVSRLERTRRTVRFIYFTIYCEQQLTDLGMVSGPYSTDDARHLAS